jgi:hypothetical protein
MPSTDTIRDLILNGYEISIHCRAYPCSNRVKADLAAVARRTASTGSGSASAGPIAADLAMSRCSSSSTSGPTQRPIAKPISLRRRRSSLRMLRGPLRW